MAIKAGQRFSTALTVMQHPDKYRFSSARFYETGEDEFQLLKHFIDTL